ncbi:MAG: histidinol-phosphatase [Desulfovibrionaceae bacterium]|nr:histidinol-phosphatase [Desulfovibrionaceae bacterium]
MITLDLHLHTKYSHGLNSPFEMYEAAKKLGLKLIGFSEHSPRPQGFDYTHEYREELTKYLPQYVDEVLHLRKMALGDPNSCQVLFGMEMDWLAGQDSFMEKSAKAFPFDYLIGSVHFIGRWGFDDTRKPWEEADQEQCETWYQAYFAAWKDMINSGRYQIAAHPDLIKIFSIDKFHIWLAKPESKAQIYEALKALKAKNMALEISSAGLRKPCREIYPAPEILAMAKELDLNVTFASDAHNTKDVASNFLDLELYAQKFGFTSSVYYKGGEIFRVPFSS